MEEVDERLKSFLSSDVLSRYSLNLFALKRRSCKSQFSFFGFGNHLRFQCLNFAATVIARTPIQASLMLFYVTSFNFYPSSASSTLAT